METVRRWRDTLIDFADADGRRVFPLTPLWVVGRVVHTDFPSFGNRFGVARGHEHRSFPRIGRAGQYGRSENLFPFLYFGVGYDAARVRDYASGCPRFLDKALLHRLVDF